MAGKWHVEHTGGRSIKVYDDWVSQYGVIYDNGIVGFDFPERLPKTVKKRAYALGKRIVKQEKLERLSNPSLLKKLKKGIKGTVRIVKGRLIIHERS